MRLTLTLAALLLATTATPATEPVTGSALWRHVMASSTEQPPRQGCRASGDCDDPLPPPRADRPIDWEEPLPPPFY